MILFLATMQKTVTIPQKKLFTEASCAHSVIFIVNTQYFNMILRAALSTTRLVSRFCLLQFPIFLCLTSVDYRWLYYTRAICQQ